MSQGLSRAVGQEPQEWLPLPVTHQNIKGSRGNCTFQCIRSLLKSHTHSLLHSSDTCEGHPCPSPCVSHTIVALHRDVRIQVTTTTGLGLTLRRNKAGRNPFGF